MTLHLVARLEVKTLGVFGREKQVAIKGQLEKVLQLALQDEEEVIVVGE
jgi:hypothetical protein